MDLGTIAEDHRNKHLSTPDKTSLPELLQEFEELFDGTLSDWECDFVSLELKEELKEGARPYHGQAFPIPKTHLKTTRKEIQRLCNLGPLKWQPDSEGASPTFIIPKKDNTVCVVSDLGRPTNKL